MKTIRKTTCFLFLCAFLISAFAVSATAVEETVTFTLSDATVDAGEEFTIDLSVSSSSKAESEALLVYGLQYDDSVLEFEGFVNYGLLITSSLTGDASVLDDQIVLGYASPIVANGSICELKFKVKDGAKSGTKINVSMTAFASKDRVPINCTVISPSCTVTVACAHVNTQNVGEQDATCKDVGYTSGVYCNDCNKFISGHAEIQKSEAHSFGDWTQTGDKYTRVCSVCGKAENTKVIPKSDDLPATVSLLGTEVSVWILIAAAAVILIVAAAVVIAIKKGRR